jgi:hypothetical protein
MNNGAVRAVVSLVRTAVSINSGEFMPGNAQSVWPGKSPPL